MCGTARQPMDWLRVRWVLWRATGARGNPRVADLLDGVTQICVLIFHGLVHRASALFPAFLCHA